MLHEALCWSHLSVEQETTVTFWRGEAIYSYWQAATNTASLPPGSLTGNPDAPPYLPVTREDKLFQAAVCACQKKRKEKNNDVHIFLN